MSNDLYGEMFFRNSDILPSSKVMVSLALAGAYCGINEGFEGNVVGFIVPSKNNPNGQQVFITPGHAGALSVNACKAILHGMGIDQELSEQILGSSNSDAETLKALITFYRVTEDTNKMTSLDFFNKRVEPQINGIFEILKKKDPYCSQNPKSLDALSTTITEAYNSFGKDQSAQNLKTGEQDAGETLDAGDKKKL